MTRLKILLDDLTDDEAGALAQMTKRMIRDDFRRLPAGRSEREAMDGTTIKLRRALAEAGFDPRSDPRRTQTWQLEPQSLLFF
jgi:hypothetical protein